MPAWSARTGHPRIDDNPGFRGRPSRSAVRDVTDESRQSWCHDPRVTLTVLVVDDHAGFRHFARHLLEATGVAVVGEAEDGRSALDAAVALRPCVVLLDVMLPDLDGFAVAERLAASADPPAVVLVSRRSREAYRRRLKSTPACGFILKTEFSGECLAALL
jgi:DNA-binding NarL/FixJ family response regulator